MRSRVQLSSVWLDRARRDRLALLLIAAVGLIVRAGTVLATRGPLVGADPIDYDRLGRLLSAGKGFGEAALSPSGGPTAFRPPLYPLFLGGVYKFTGGSVTGARLVQAVIGLVTVGLVWAIGHHLFGRRIALTAAALAAVYLPLVLTTQALMSESILVPALLGATLTALLARDALSPTRWMIVSGALMGLCILARPNSAVAFPALLALVVSNDARAAGIRTMVKPAVILLGTAMLVLLPWEVRNYREFHQFVPVSDIDGYNLAGVYNQDSAEEPYPKRYQFRPPNSVAEVRALFDDERLNEATLGTELRRAGMDFIKEHPTAPLEAEFWNSFRLLELAGLDSSATAAKELGYGRGAAAASMLVFWIALALAIGGAVSRSARAAPLAFWLIPVSLWVGTTLFLGETRMRAPIEPFLLLLAAAGATRIIERVFLRASMDR